MDEQELHKRLYPAAHKKQEYVICAALYYDDGIKHPHQPQNIASGMVICGRRHHNCYITLAQCFLEKDERKIEQGFLTSKDRYVNRKEGGTIAFAAGQIPNHTDCLFSEALY